jgi:HSP20 family protein
MRDEARFRRIFFLSSVPSADPGLWQPRADIYRTPTGWLVKLELAGVQPQDVEVFLKSGRLIVQGTRRDECIATAGRCYHMEIAYSRFERVLELPEVCEPAELHLTYQHGMLLVEVTPSQCK